MILGATILKGVSQKFKKGLRVKNLSNIRNLGRQVYREKKVGENNPLPQNVKDKYKNNFENILFTIMNNKVSTGKPRLTNEEDDDQISEIQIEIKRNHITKDAALLDVKSNTTSEDSCEDIYERAVRFQNSLNLKNDSDLNVNRILLVKQIFNEPVILKKHSFLKISDEFENSELSPSDSDEEVPMENHIEPEKEENLILEKL